MHTIVVPLTTFILFLMIWELIVELFNISSLILPAPTDVLIKLYEQAPYLFKQSSITLAESVFGFLLGCSMAIALAILFQYSKTLNKAFYPYAIAIKAIPLVALAPVVVLWFGTGLASKIILAAIISFFPILVNTIQGLNSTEPEAVDLLETLSATKTDILFKLRLPTALPFIFTGMKVSSTFAVVGAVVAEFVGANSGIGYVVKSSSYYLDTDLTFAAIFMAASIGLLFFGVIAQLEKKVIFWNSEK